MASIRALCDRALLIKEGRVALDGDVDHVVTEYLSETSKASGTGEIRPEVARIGSGDARFTRVELNNRGGAPLTQVYLGQPVTVVLTVDAARSISDAVLEVGISSLEGVRVTSSFSTDGEQDPFALGRGRSTVALDLDLTLLPGHYTIDLGLHHSGARTIDFVERIFDFEVLNAAESGADAYPTAVVRGFVRPQGHWHEPEPEREPSAVRTG
jgi:hypothetical protein